ncbi:MAG: hypothetical protein E7058_02530 [Lentisphaerae bacterium]|nr:hypothetical protein [Lentisphaerota bacterium]
MKKQLLQLLTTALFCLTVRAAEIAVIHDNTITSMHEEAAILEKNIATDRYKISELPGLVRKLPSYRMVIFGTTANYHARIDFKKYHAQFRNFLRDGGILLILDANYPEVLGATIDHLADSKKLVHNWGCGNMENLGMVTPLDPYKQTLFTFPVKGGSDEFPLWLRGGHFVKISAPWQPVAKCRCGHTVIAEHSYGKGKIIVTPLFALFSADGKRFVASLAQNLLFRQKCAKSGVEVRDFHVDYRAAKPRFTLQLRNISGKELEVDGRIIFSENLLPMQNIKRRLAPGAIEKIDLELACARPVTAGVVLQTLQLAFTGKFAPPDLSPVYHLPDRIFPARAKEFNIPVKHRQKAAFSGAYLLTDNQRIAAKINNEQATLITVDLSSLPAGKHTLQPVLLTKEGKELLLPEKTVTVTGKNMKLDVDPRGNLLRDGKLFYPMVWYHVSLAAGVTQKSKLECLDFTARYGYNTVFILSDGRKEDDEFMRLAAEKNIAVICSNRGDHIIKEKKDLWSAVISWGSIDEPEHWGHTPEDVRKMAARSFELDPRCPIFSSMETIHTLKRYAGVTDMFATHGYPVGVTSLDLVSRKLRLLTDLAQQYMFVPIGTVQCFGYPGQPATGYTVMPTPSQVRNMTWQALAANIKGITWYTFADGGFNLPDHKPLYELMKKLPREVHLAIPFIQHGSYSRPSTGDNKVYAARWIKGDEILEVYINTDTRTRSITVNPVPGVKPVFGSRPVMSRITLKPEEVVIWKK